MKALEPERVLFSRTVHPGDVLTVGDVRIHLGIGRNGRQIEIDAPRGTIVKIKHKKKNAPQEIRES